MVVGYVPLIVSFERSSDSILSCGEAFVDKFHIFSCIIISEGGG